MPEFTVLTSADGSTVSVDATSEAGIADELRHLFTSLGLDQIDRYIAMRANETVQLEFKTITSTNFDHRPDRKNLAISLGGFANSAGGIIVWGIDARKVKENHTVSGAPFENLTNFIMRLHELTGEATSPIVPGIVHKSIAISPNCGYVATFVPQSDGGPHMSKLGEDRYYKRNSDRFVRMEHFDLDDMFGRRPKPILKLHIENYIVNPDGSESLALYISNIGRSIAKHSGMFMNLNNVLIISATSPLQDISHLNNGRSVIQYSNDTGVIHSNGIRISIGSISFKRVEFNADMVINTTIYCDGQKAAIENYTIRPTP
jgi:hypothetical protein